MEQKKLIEYVFYSAISGIGTIGVSYVQRISESLIKLTANVADLNAKMEVASMRWSQADESLKDHETRLRRIETNAKK